MLLARAGAYGFEKAREFARGVDEGRVDKCRSSLIGAPVERQPENRRGAGVERFMEVVHALPSGAVCAAQWVVVMQPLAQGASVVATGGFDGDLALTAGDRFSVDTARPPPHLPAWSCCGGGIRAALAPSVVPTLLQLA